MNDEITILKNRLLPIFKMFVVRFDANEDIGASPMEMEELEEFGSSDATANYIFSNLITRTRSCNVGAAYFSTYPARFKYFYTETDYAEKLTEEGLFIFGDGGDGSIFALNLNDRKIYHIDVSWGDDLDWKQAVLDSWNSFNEFVDYVEAEATKDAKEQETQS